MEEGATGCDPGTCCPGTRAHHRTARYMGTTAFPLMVPVTRSHPEAANMRRIREFLSTWTRPTLILYSQSSLLPWIQSGDFVVGRRPDFYSRLIPGVVRVRRVGGQAGHLVMWDAPYQVLETKTV